MKIVPLKPGLLWLVACVSIAAFSGTRTAGAQSLLDGYYNPLFNEDRYAIFGSETGDFAGLPLTRAALKAAYTWDAEQTSLPALQCAAYASYYGPRNPGLMRIWEDRDPYTQRQTQIETWTQFASMHRHIWMVPRPHPPPWALDTWQGYSTGRWVGNVLWVHTDKLKPFYNRQGEPTDDQMTMDERFFRYGNLLTIVQMLSDPQYLSRPYVRGIMLSRVPQGVMTPYSCTPNDEISRGKGTVPMYLPGTDKGFIAGPVSRGIPIQATLGGAQTMYPEYQDYLKTLPHPSPSQIEKAEQKAVNEATGQ